MEGLASTLAKNTKHESDWSICPQGWRAIPGSILFTQKHNLCSPAVHGDLSCATWGIYSARCLILEQTPTRGPVTHSLNPADDIN